jgi:hypothetical protein
LPKKLYWFAASPLVRHKPYKPAPVVVRSGFWCFLQVNN